MREEIAFRVNLSRAGKRRRGIGRDYTGSSVFGRARPVHAPRAAGASRGEPGGNVGCIRGRRIGYGSIPLRGRSRGLPTPIKHDSLTGGRAAAGSSRDRCLAESGGRAGPSFV